MTKNKKGKSPDIMLFAKTKNIKRDNNAITAIDECSRKRYLELINELSKYSTSLLKPEHLSKKIFQKSVLHMFGFSRKININSPILESLLNKV